MAQHPVAPVKFLQDASYPTTGLFDLYPIPPFYCSSSGLAQCLVLILLALPQPAARPRNGVPTETILKPSAPPLQNQEHFWERTVLRQASSFSALAMVRVLLVGPRLTQLTLLLRSSFFQFNTPRPAWRYLLWSPHRSGSLRPGGVG